MQGPREHVVEKHDGAATTLVGEDGSTIIPTIVPPTIEFPVTTPGGTPKRADESETATPPAAKDFAAQPPSSAVQEGLQPSADTTRPTVTKQWQTERPRPTARTSTLPGLRRKGTNTSALNEAIWNRPTNYESSSSSSSSEDENDNDTVESTAKDSRRSRKGSRASDEERRYSRFNVKNDDFKTRGRVSKRDGRLNISVNETNNRGYLAKTLGANFLKHLDPSTNGKTNDTAQEYSAGRSDKRRSSDKHHSRSSSESTVSEDPLKVPRPKLNIVIMVIGSRGDIQPFLKVGKVLKDEYGHRVRIATHPAFRDFVQKDSGLEFFSVGGNPAELMSFM
jgi:hypothetical protein